MIRITKLTDYGIVLMSLLSASVEHRSKASELAAESRLPLPMVSKILKQLTRAGLLASVRGVNGGYCLTRPAESITIAEIIAALEGPIAMTECSSDVTGECELEAFCAVRSNWQRINRAIRDALDGITLEEMTVTRVPLGLVGLGATSLEA